jgi:hypothetical protein
MLGQILIAVSVMLALYGLINGKKRFTAAGLFVFAFWIGLRLFNFA